jgi:predicted RNase H-like HicB family nuclease
MMTYDTYLEVFPDGRVSAQVLDLPGCFAYGASEIEAQSNLRVAIPDYFRWLSMQDTDTPTVSGEVELAVRERVEVTMQGLHEVRAFFTPDAVPLSDDDLGWGLALMSYAHVDLRRYTADLPSPALDWQSTADVWSIRQIIDHLAQMEIWLATRLDAQPQVPVVTELPGSAFERYDKIHERAMLRYSSTTPEQRAAITEHTGERWSLRKMLRRSIVHEREHTEQIALVLAQHAAGT